MILFMIIGGLGSTMNLWANSWSDVRLSMNDVYMISIMTSIMILLMSLNDKYFKGVMISAIVLLLSIVAVRYQFLITESQFIRGMIPHHSMAILMVNRLREKPHSKELVSLLDSIITTQQQEIEFMKKIESQ